MPANKYWIPPLENLYYIIARSATYIKGFAEKNRGGPLLQESRPMPQIITTAHSPITVWPLTTPTARTRTQ